MNRITLTPVLALCMCALSAMELPPERSPEIIRHFGTLSLADSNDQTSIENIKNDPTLSFAKKLDALNALRKKTPLDSRKAIQEHIEELCQQEISSILNSADGPQEESPSAFLAVCSKWCKGKTYAETLKEIEKITNYCSLTLSNSKALFYMLLCKNNALTNTEKLDLCTYLLEKAKKSHDCPTQELHLLLDMFKKIHSIQEDLPLFGKAIIHAAKTQNPLLTRFLCGYSLKPCYLATTLLVTFLNYLIELPDNQKPENSDDFVSLLLEHGALVSLELPADSTITKTPLNVLIQYCTAQTIQKCIDAGADINWLDPEGTKTLLDLFEEAKERYPDKREHIETLIHKARACGAKTYQELNEEK